MHKPDTSMGDRIRRVRQARRLTQAAFAESLGIGQSFLSSIEQGKKIPSDTLLIAMSHRYELDERWLFSGKGEAGAGPLPSADVPPPPTAEMTPLLRRISATFPQSLDSEDVLGHITLPGISPDSYAMVVYGNFMAPTIQNNDLAIFKLTGEATNGDIVLVNDKWGDVILRRYRVKADGIWFSPDNSDYKPFQPGPRPKVIGVVTKIWRDVKF